VEQTIAPPHGIAAIVIAIVLAFFIKEAGAFVCAPAANMSA
jgi:hypothetical protein